MARQCDILQSEPIGCLFGHCAQSPARRKQPDSYEDRIAARTRKRRASDDARARHQRRPPGRGAGGCALSCHRKNTPGIEAHRDQCRWALRSGRYEIVFHAGRYFREAGAKLPEPAFLDEVPIRFGISDASAHYHVPLLISPYGYSTYRGS
jgi:HIUase/Transthyretin family